MCMSSPNIPTPTQPQEAKMPTMERKRAATPQQGTVLTSPSGVSMQSNTGGATLLGG